MRNLEVCLAPELLGGYPDREAIVVILDIYRATTSICTAFRNGVDRLIPVATIDEARRYKSEGYLVAGERDGQMLEFADFGNSPFNFTRERVEGKTVVYTTTNGTRTIHLASPYHMTIIGSFLNGEAVARYLAGTDRNVLLLCAGWKGRFNLEDTVCAGFLSQKLLLSGLFETNCDSVFAAIDLWKLAESDLQGYLGKAAHRSRLQLKGLDDCIEYCLTIDTVAVIPVLRDGLLVAMSPDG
ncbi:MAG: 2-phosphosulfolactate phosphatase [Bacteroidales bacterium]|nr:2-phosphosulfolactate phosphatase [Bacteroidales bacterium]